MTAPGEVRTLCAAGANDARDTADGPIESTGGSVAVGLACLVFALALSIGLTALPIATMMLFWGLGIACAGVASVAEGHLTLPRARLVPAAPRPSELR